MQCRSHENTCHLSNQARGRRIWLYTFEVSMARTRPKLRMTYAFRRVRESRLPLLRKRPDDRPQYGMHLYVQESNLATWHAMGVHISPLRFAKSPDARGSASVAAADRDERPRGMMVP